MRTLREEAIRISSDEKRSFNELYGKDTTLFEDENVDDVIDPRMRKLFESIYGENTPKRLNKVVESIDDDDSGIFEDEEDDELPIVGTEAEKRFRDKFGPLDDEDEEFDLDTEFNAAKEDGLVDDGEEFEEEGFEVTTENTTDEEIKKDTFLINHSDEIDSEFEDEEDDELPIVGTEAEKRFRDKFGPLDDEDEEFQQDEFQGSINPDNFEEDF